MNRRNVIILLWISHLANWKRLDNFEAEKFMPFQLCTELWTVKLNVHIDEEIVDGVDNRSITRTRAPTTTQFSRNSKRWLTTFTIADNLLRR